MFEYVVINVRLLKPTVKLYFRNNLMVSVCLFVWHWNTQKRLNQFNWNLVQSLYMCPGGGGGGDKSPAVQKFSPFQDDGRLRHYYRAVEYYLINN